MRLLTRNGIVNKLNEVDRLLLSESMWTRHHNACDENGNAVSPDSYKACKFNIRGAIWYVCSNDTHYKQLMMAIHNVLPLCTNAGEYNDNHEFWQVKEIIHKAKIKAKHTKPFEPLPSANPLNVFRGSVLLIFFALWFSWIL